MKIIDTLRTIKQELRNSIHDWKAHYIVTLDQREENILSELTTKGFSIVPNFYSMQECEIMRKSIDDLVAKYGTQVRVDKEGSDHRIFGADRVSDSIGKFYTNPFINKIVKGHEKTNRIEGLTLAARLEYRPNNQGSGGGWHRDWAVNKQIKAMLYLSDVDEKHGPFQFIDGSQRHVDIIRETARYNFQFNKTRFSDEEIAPVIASQPQALHTLTAPAGTLILVNTRGLHRGAPIQSGTRYALTNYYWSNMSIPEHVAKLIVK